MENPTTNATDEESAMKKIENTMPVCTLNQVEKRFQKGTCGLGPLSLELYGGEILGVLGNNGAGKSTLLKIIAGIIRPDAGACRHHEDLTGRIGYVPQEIALYGTLSGMDNLRFWGQVYGLGRKAVALRSRWILEQMELSEKGSMPVSTYSGGMQRRLHLASALMVTPRLLLLDESTVGADMHSVDLILSMMEHLRNEGCSLVFISHRAEEIARVCDRTVTLENGLVTVGWERSP
ncbi:MAG: glnQ [Bacillota bacterium]|nr:glnQ [Bacillota bacterium]